VTLKRNDNRTVNNTIHTQIRKASKHDQAGIVEYCERASTEEKDGYCIEMYQGCGNELMGHVSLSIDDVHPSSFFTQER
jgi:hypothetical protein